MADRQDDIQAILTRLRQDRSAIEAEYRSCLRAQHVDDDLRIDVKRFFGDLRSALDYLAHDVCDACCPTVKPTNRLYFPITSGPADFQQRMARSYPGLSQNRPNLQTHLESVQPYHGQDNIWLSHMNQVNNAVKHVELVAQTRSERPQVKLTCAGGGTRLAFNPRQVTFGKGAKVSIGAGVTVERITWVDFRLTEPDVSVLGLMDQSLDGVTRIVDDVTSLLP